MARQAIDARGSFSVAIHVRDRRRKIDGGARGSNELMAKIVVVEEAVHVGAEDTT